MKELTIEEIKKLDTSAYVKYCSEVMGNAIYDKNNRAINVDKYHNVENVWEPTMNPTWSFDKFYYRTRKIKTRLMTDKECRQFIKDNIKNIILVDDSKIETIPAANVLFYCGNIAKLRKYIWIKDIDIDDPYESKTNKFEITE